METVADLMTPNPIVVRDDKNIVDCALLLMKHKMRHLPVVDRDGRLAGVVHDFDVFNKGGLIGVDQQMWVSYDEGDEALTAGELAVPANVVAGADDTLQGRLKHILSTKQDGAVVIDEDRKVIGIITEHDGVQLAQDLLPPHLTATHEGIKGVHTVSKDALAMSALELMGKHRIRHVLVLDGERLHGVISWRDLIEDDVQPGSKLTADDVLRERYDVVTVAPDAALRTVADRMAQHGIGCIPIVNFDNIPVGVLTRTDIIEALILRMEEDDLFSG